MKVMWDDSALPHPVVAPCKTWGVRTGIKIYAYKINNQKKINQLWQV